MALRISAKYEFGLPFARFIPHNDDGTIPTAIRIFGGTGPFDFSGVTDISAVQLYIKQDAGAATSIEVNLSAASSQSAVTVAELVTALNSAATPALSTIDMLASAATGKNGSTRIKLASTDTATTPTWIQVYGEFAQLAKFGKGFGLKIVKCNTLQTFGITPTLKEDETFTTTDADGIDTEIISDGYRKGSTATIVDTAKDKELKVLMLGGSYNSSTGLYEAGTSESDRYTFLCELYYPYYSQGTNQEADLVGYIKKVIRNAKGSIGEDPHAREWSIGNYTLTGVSYKDESGNLLADEYEQELTIAAYNALDLENV
jgi:hypothetical protein